MMASDGRGIRTGNSKELTEDTASEDKEDINENRHLPTHFTTKVQRNTL